MLDYGGIDGIGILQLNPFVSFKGLLRRKCYRGSVSHAEVGDFRNTMSGRADEDILLTIGAFSPEDIRVLTPLMTNRASPRRAT